ncbi:hypothetical protein NECID01_2140 [Nematocida sp. AWRm77]|nr:hypothetical protein NECID01_2140 [Nematocida sp. AWRm77]
MCRTPTGMPEFSKDLAQRGLTSVCSREIVEQCTASEHWLGHNMFWRMLMFFVDTLSLEIADSNRLEGKKTVVLRDRKLHKKPLSECSYKSMWNVISRYRDAERMEIQCSLNFLEGRSTVDVLCVLRWLLYHVKIEYVGIACDFTEPQITSEVLIRQIADLIKERRGSRVRIDSLALHFTLAQYMAAAGIVKKCPWITVLKIHFIDDDLYGDDDIEKALESLLPHCPALDQLSVFGIRIGIDHIQIITEILPQLVVLEVELLNLSMLTFGQKEKKKSNREAVPTEFPNISTLKVSDLYNYSGPGIKKFMGLFPNLKSIQILASFVTIPMIDALSRLRLLRSLEILNGTLFIETAEDLLEKLPGLECLYVGVKELDNKVAHALSKCTSMHTLSLRGRYTPGFLAFLLQPSPLMSTLKVLYFYKHSGFYKASFNAEDLSRKGSAMENFGCEVKIRY